MVPKGRGADRKVFFTLGGKKTPREIMELTYALIPLLGQALEENVTPLILFALT
jgi:hypothetical protein